MKNMVKSFRTANQVAVKFFDGRTSDIRIPSTIIFCISNGGLFESGMVSEKLNEIN